MSATIPPATSSPRFVRFSCNRHGRDFVVGDIHACFAELETLLHQIGFESKHDRLFSVGDLVDRGPDPELALSYLAKPWFHAVRGNHEQMAIGIAAGRHDHEIYRRNGGAWFLALPTARQQQFATAFAALPYAIEIETRTGAVGVVHADAPYAWSKIERMLLDPELSPGKLRTIGYRLLWSRQRIEQADPTPVPDIERVLVGHSPLPEVLTLGNVTHLDTGAVFGGRLTVVQIDSMALSSVPVAEYSPPRRD